MISLIIPTYNHEKELPETLDSIFAQQEKDIEVIVVNDGSKDQTNEAVRPYLDRIQYIKQENAGAPVARNRGFKESKGEYVMFCDADLVMEKDMLTKLKNALEKNPDAAFSYGSFKWGWKLFKSNPFNHEELKQMNYIHTSSLIRRKDFPGFDESLKKFQDWDLWLTIAEQGKKGIFIDEVLCTIAPHEGGISTWLPKIAYKIPWKLFGKTPAKIEKYEKWKKIVQEKHGIGLDK